VYKKFFLDTFNVSVGRLDRAFHASVSGTDLDGKMTGSSRKTTEEAIIAVKEHIQNFPAFESHYTRSHNPGRKYLSLDLDIRKILKLYDEKCEENKVSRVNEWIYRKNFNEKFNLHFQHPRKTHARNVICGI
jgi:hypothetical protein